MNNKNPTYSNSRSNKPLAVSFSGSLNTLAPPPINNTNSSNSTTPRNTTRAPLPFASHAPVPLNIVTMAPNDTIPFPPNNSNSSNSTTPRNTTRSIAPLASHAPMAYYKSLLFNHSNQQRSSSASNPSTSAANRLQPPFSSANLLSFGSVMLFLLLTLLFLKKQEINEEHDLLVKDTDLFLTPSQVEQLTSLQQRLDCLSNNITDVTDLDNNNSAKNTHDFLLERLDELNQTTKKLLALSVLTNDDEGNKTGIVAMNTLVELEHDIDTITYDIGEHLQGLTLNTPALR